MYWSEQRNYRSASNWFRAHLIPADIEQSEVALRCILLIYTSFRLSAVQCGTHLRRRWSERLPFTGSIASLCRAEGPCNSPGCSMGGQWLAVPQCVRPVIGCHHPSAWNIIDFDRRRRADGSWPCSGQGELDVSRSVYFRVGPNSFRRVRSDAQRGLIAAFKPMDRRVDELDVRRTNIDRCQYCNSVRSISLSLITSSSINQAAPCSDEAFYLYQLSQYINCLNS